MEEKAASAVEGGGAVFRPLAAPFLYWPVSRREFYQAICVALVPALAWGVVLFGGRVLAMLGLAVAASGVTSAVLTNVVKSRRARAMPYGHCLLSDLVLVALAHPTWPVWLVGALALVMPLVLVLAGGVGKERVHVAVVLALATQYFVLPAMAPTMYAGKADAVLAQDRLVMGDIQNQGGEAGGFTAHPTWPTARELGGNDAALYRMPAVVAAEALDAVAEVLPAREGTGTRRGSGGLAVENGGRGGVDMTKTRGGVDAGAIRKIVDPALALGLPRMDRFWYGVAPNRVGAASLMGLMAAGLYLSYRYILRPRSAALFMVVYVAASALLVFLPATVDRSGVVVVWEVLKNFPGEMLTLFVFLVMNSDAGFAAVIILALPGTEPLTVRGRRVFLAVAAVAAAWLHRLDPGMPAATLALCVLMPGAWLFDRVLVQRSWVNK